MFTVKLANIPVEIDNRYAHVQKYCNGWETDEAPAFRVKVAPDEISDYIRMSSMPVDEPTAERILVYFKICAHMPEFDAFLVHGAVVECNSHGIIFAAKRGVGKSTHVELLRKYYGDEIRVVNGDKPIVRREGNLFVAYGTPWRGKEGFGENSSVKVDRICFIERGNNTMRRVEPDEAAKRLSGQTVYPADRKFDDVFARNMADFLRSVKLCCASVDMTPDAAHLTRKLANAK